MRIKPAISQILLGKNDFCRLCFDLMEGNTYGLQDEVLINVDSTVEVAEILNIVFGGKVNTIISAISSLDVICNKCLDAARNSYNFMTKCQENSELLSNTLDSLTDCLDNVLEDVSSYKSVFIHVSAKDYSSKQYYDTEFIEKEEKNVFNRFKCLTKSRKQIVSKIKEEPKGKRTRIHNYSDEINAICKIKREKNRSKFECRVCSAVFTKSFNFKKHYHSRHSIKTFACDECGRSYGSEMLLKLHKNDSHSKIMCTKCGKTYKNRYSLLYHMRQHTGDKPYQCPHCDMKFPWSSRRAEHIRRYHLEPSVECDICHVKFRALGSLYDHRKRHFNPNSRLLVTQQTPPVAIETVIT